MSKKVSSYRTIESFYSENIGFGEGGDLERAVKEATSKAQLYILETEEEQGDEVKIISCSAHSIDRGNFAAYVITLVLEIISTEESEEDA